MKTAKEITQEKMNQRFKANLLNPRLYAYRPPKKISNYVAGSYLNITKPLGA